MSRVVANLKDDQFINDHGAVAARQVAYAVLSVIGCCVKADLGQRV